MMKLGARSKLSKIPLSNLRVRPRRILREGHMDILQRQSRLLNTLRNPRCPDPYTRPPRCPRNRRNQQRSRSVEFSFPRSGIRVDHLLPRALHIEQRAQFPDWIARMVHAQINIHRPSIRSFHQQRRRFTPCPLPARQIPSHQRSYQPLRQRSLTPQERPLHLFNHTRASQPVSLNAVARARTCTGPLRASRFFPGVTRSPPVDALTIPTCRAAIPCPSKFPSSAKIFFIASAGLIPCASNANPRGP